jgi:hypothetical protein
MSTRGATVGGAGTLGPQASFIDDGISPAPGASLWQTCPLLAGLCDLHGLCIFEDDFIGLTKTADTWIATQATSGTATAGVLAGGTCALSAGATTNHQGEQLQRAGGHFIPAVSKSIWFECRLKTNLLTLEFLAGLADIDTGLITTGAVHATDCIAFSSVTGDGVLLQNVASGGTHTTAAGPTLVAATYVKLGFVLTSNTSVQFFVNGTAQGAPVTTNIPAVTLAPSFVCQATGTGTPQVDIDWVMCAQLR